MAIDLQALAAPVWVETAGLGQRFDFGCVPLGPGDFDSHAATLFGLVAGIDGTDKPAREPVAADLENMQILACLTVRHIRQPDGEPEAVRFVLSEADEDTDARRLWVGRLPLQEVGEIAGVGIRTYAEAAARAVRFRRRSAAIALARRDGEAVRDDPGAMDREAG